jgi:hypothetical protein
MKAVLRMCSFTNKQFIKYKIFVPFVLIEINLVLSKVYIYFIETYGCANA